MKRILLIFFLFSCVFANAQDQGSCGTNTIIFANGTVSFPNGYISPAIKIGAWRTLGKVAPVISVAYQFDDTYRLDDGKSGKVIKFNRVALEVGAKIRLTDRIFLHGYAGLSDPKCYLGADLLLKLDEFALMGVGFRNNSPSATVYIRLNK